ncbi:MAG: hypothetical protein JRG91_12845 [Deltaproteobacteria bacterium]|nr:hypothetical protein [Deltaproteobacteria bacterium]
MSGRERRYGSRETDVGCPGCGEGTLHVIVSCMSAKVTCPDCHAAFTLSELSGRLAPEDFSRLADVVGDRTSDRV